MDSPLGDRGKERQEIGCTREAEIRVRGNLSKPLESLWLRQLAGDLLCPGFFERDGNEASVSFQDPERTLRLAQISAEK